MLVKSRLADVHPTFQNVVIQWLEKTRLNIANLSLLSMLIQALKQVPHKSCRVSISGDIKSQL